MEAKPGKIRKLIDFINANGKLLLVLIVLLFCALGYGSAVLLIFAANNKIFFPVAFAMFTVYITIFAFLMDRKR